MLCPRITPSGRPCGVPPTSSPPQSCAMVSALLAGGGRGRSRRLPRAAADLIESDRTHYLLVVASAFFSPTGIHLAGGCSRQARRSQDRGWPHPFFAYDPAALRAPLQVDRDAVAEPSKDGSGLSAAPFGRLKEGWFDGHNASRKGDLVEALRLSLGRRRPSPGAPRRRKVCFAALNGATPGGRKKLVGFGRETHSFGAFSSF